MELHVWGHKDNIALIDAECLATIWYLSLALNKELFTVVTSSNTDLSSSAKLPLLELENGDKIDGYINIIRYISTNYTDLDDRLTKEFKALNSGLLYYIHDNLSVTSDYALYLNKSNYEDFSRSIFKRYLPFPMQYNTPLKYRSNAKANCARIGLNVEDKTEVEEEMLKNVPTVSKIQKLNQEMSIESKLILKNSVTNMKCLNQLKTALETIENLQNEIGKSNSTNNIFGEFITSSDLLLLAYLTVLTNKELPDQFITNFISKVFPSFLTYKEVNTFKVNYNIREPHFSESPNLLNSIKHLFL